MLRIHIEADTPEEAATFLRLIAASPTSLADAVLDAPTDPKPRKLHVVRAPIAPTVETTVGTPVQETVQETLAPSVEAADEEIDDTPDPDDAPDVTYNGEWPAVLVDNVALAHAILSVYDKNPKTNTQALFAALTHFPTTQDRIRILRQEMIGHGLLRTKGKKSPHHVTPTGHAFYSDERLVQIVADTAAPSLDAAPSPTTAAQAPVALGTVAPPVTPGELSDLGRAILASATAAGTDAKTRVVDAMRALVKEFGVAAITAVPAERRAEFRDRLEAIRTTF